MARYFKSKKALRYEIILKYIFVLVLSYLFIRLCIYSLTYISPMSYLNTNSIFKGYYHNIRENTINKPVFLLNYKYKSDNIVSIPVIKIENDKKRIYIYNTHQKEKYVGGNSVVDAAKYFKEILGENGFDVELEMGNIQEFLISNNYSYDRSYIASRYFIEEEIKTGNYDLIIDFHRDAVTKKASTATIDGKNYAKIMFVIGKKNKNYALNYEVAKGLNDIIAKQYPELTRGILLQSGSSVNGLYNQDIATNMILIEVGGNSNTFEEVINTLQLITPLIGEYLNEQKISSI